MGGALSGRLRRFQEPLVVGTAAVALIVFALFPLLILAWELVGGGVASFETTLGAARTWTLLGETLALALAVTSTRL